LGLSGKKRSIVIASTALLLLNLFAGMASAGSHYPLSVVLSNDSAEGKAQGETFDVHAQVYQGDVPANATNVTFRFGLGTISNVFPATTYPGVYNNSTGLYRATVTMAFFDTIVGISGLVVTVRSGNDSATSFRVIATAPPTAGPGPSGPWTVTAGLNNTYRLGRTVDPGENMVWRIDTYDNGTHADAASLTLNHFSAPDVKFTETPTALTPVKVATGVYEANFTVPSSLTASMQYVLQATVNETNFAQANSSVDVWFFDTVVSYAVHNQTLIQGRLTVGDGTAVVPGLAVALNLTEMAVPSHLIGRITGTTDAAGLLSFSLVNDGTTQIDVTGWINATGGKSQFVMASLTLPPDYTPPAPTAGRFEAVPLENFSLLPWSGLQYFDFQVYNNATAWQSRNVTVIVSSSRGPISATNMTTDPSGNATVSVDFSALPAVSDDLFNNGINVTFRAAVGNDSSASDGRFWGEDAELVLPDSTPNLARQAIDSNLQFVTEPLALGSAFGVGARYTGGKNTTGFEGGAVLIPGSIEKLFGGLTETYDVWTSHDQPFINLLVKGPDREFFGPVQVPSYWPVTKYTLLVAVVPSLSLLGSGNEVTQGALNWIELLPTYSVQDFTPMTDITPPQVFGPDDMTINTSELANFTTHAYDDSLTFHADGYYTWNVYYQGGVLDVIHGESTTWTSTFPGDYNVRLVVEDAGANFAEHWFTVHVLDITPPSVDAGQGFTVLAGTPANFSGTARDDDPAFTLNGTVDWSFLYNGSTVTVPGSFAGSAVSGNFTFWVPGSYNVTLTARDPAGHAATDTVAVAVTAPDTLAPTVNAGLDRTVLAGEVSPFSGFATDNDPLFPAGATCGWTFNYNGSSRSFNGTSFNFTFWTLGNYDVLFFCLDFWGNLGQDTVTVTVDRPDKVAPVVNAGPDVTVTTGSVVTRQGLTTDNDPAFPAGSSAYWVFDYQGTAHNLSGTGFSYRFDAAGSYLLTLFVADGWGNIGSDTMTVTVNPPDTTAPAIPAFGDQSITAGTWANLTAAVTDDDPNFATTGNVTWSFTYGGSPVQQSGTAFAFLFDTEGSFTVTVRAADGAGNVAARTFVVRVVAPDTTPPTVTASADHVSAVVGTPVTFVGSAIDAGSPINDASRFDWTFTYDGVPKHLSGFSPNFTFEKTGSYTVTLSVRDGAGNVGTAQVTVTVTTAPPGETGTTGGDLIIPLLVLLLVGAGVVGFIVMRRRGADDERVPPRAAPRDSRPSGGGAPPAPASRGGQGADDADKDLDNLLQ
jgi:hypothetical protein